MNPSPPLFIYRLLEYICQDKALLRYLDELKDQASQAYRGAIKIEQEKDFFQDSLKGSLLKMEQLHEQLEQSTPVSNDWENLVHSLIENRDQLQLYLDNICRGEDALTAKLIERQLQDTARMLRNVGVEVLDETGVFDCTMQMVVGTRYTKDEQLVNCVMRYVQLKYRKRYLVNLQSSSMDK